MGLHISPLDLNVRFAKSDKNKIIEVFKNLKADERRRGTGGTSSEKRYAFAGPIDLDSDLEDLFENFRYVLEEEGDFYVINDFSGSKIGDDYLFWKRLKPLVQPGSVCQFSIESIDSDDDDDGLIDFLD